MHLLRRARKGSAPLQRRDELERFRHGGRYAIREYLKVPLSHGVSDLAFDVAYITQQGTVARDVGTYRMTIPQNDWTKEKTMENISPSRAWSVRAGCSQLTCGRVICRLQLDVRPCADAQQWQTMAHRTTSCGRDTFAASVRRRERRGFELLCRRAGQNPSASFGLITRFLGTLPRGADYTLV